MKKAERVLLFLSGFLVALGLVLNLNVAMAQGRASSPDAPEAGAATYRAIPASASRSELTFQGRLMDSNGVPINGVVSMIFKLYKDDDTTVVWQSIMLPIQVVNGLFTALVPDPRDDNLPTESDFASTAFIGVTVWPDAEMTPHQPINTVVGHGLTGVVGGGTSGSGVFAYNNSSTTGALRAKNNVATGPALEIGQGAIKVTNAGLNSSTPVFVHQVNTSSNLCSGQNWSTVVDNPFTNNQPGAILIVTPHGGGYTPATGIPAVYYDETGTCGKGAGRWVIYNLNSQAQTNNSLFNVLVVQP